VIPAQESPDPKEPSVASLADGWQELARQLRFLALRGTAVHPDDALRFQALAARGGESIRAIASRAPEAGHGLQTQTGARALAVRMLQSGGSESDTTHPADRVDRPPSRSHSLTLSGSGSVLPAQDIILLLAARKQTGALKLRTQRETFTLEFDQGQVAHMHTSNAEQDERLGDLLVRRGVLTALQVEDIRQHSRGRIGEVLLEKEFVTELQLLAALEMQVHLLIGRLCQARVEQFAFRRGALTLTQQRLRLDVSELLLAPRLLEPGSGTPAIG